MMLLVIFFPRMTGIGPKADGAGMGRSGCRSEAGLAGREPQAERFRKMRARFRVLKIRATLAPETAEGRSV
jgi:hypothetical protein